MEFTPEQLLEFFPFLDKINRDGISVHAAPAYLYNSFPQLTITQAKEVVFLWNDTFKENLSVEERIWDCIQ
jgi:hypothetical protein